MMLDQLLAAAPQFHTDRGRPWSWKLSDDALRFIDMNVTYASQTLETGEGVSTALFALKGCRHTCVSPDENAIARIVAFCQENQVNLDRVFFPRSKSQDFLPLVVATETLGTSRTTRHDYLKNRLDLALIDGGHEFPIPFIDWYYTAFMLKVGGILVLDDTQLRTCALLKEFLLTEPEWRVMTQDHNRWIAFEKVAEGHSKPWTSQGFMRDWKTP